MLYERQGKMDEFEALMKRVIELDPNNANAYNSLGYTSEEHTSELQSLMRTSYAVFCLTKKTKGDFRTNRRRPGRPGGTPRAPPYSRHLSYVPRAQDRTHTHLNPCHHLT